MTNATDAGSVRREMVRYLTPKYGEGEAVAMMRLIFRVLKGWDTTGLIVHEGDELSEFTIGEIKDVLRQLDEEKPIQYILGTGRFYGMDLKVTPATLIPRPETEELVDIIVDENRGRHDLRVLDVGTGSGAIAIALARNLSFSRVTALDISEEALEVAGENAERLNADVRFVKGDVFAYEPEGEYDVVVSNPPYIAESEKNDMDRNVLEYEPERALFVPDSDPLVFYRRISELGKECLASGGCLYFEINPLFAAGLKTMLENSGYTDISITRDISGKERFAEARLPG